MRPIKNAAVLVLVGLIVAAPAIAHATPPAPPPPGDVAAPPPPPPPPGDTAAPPPPRGAAVIIDRGPDKRIHVDVRCAEADTTRACADLTTQLFDKVNAATPAQ